MLKHKITDKVRNTSRKFKWDLIQFYVHDAISMQNQMPGLGSQTENPDFIAFSLESLL